jgi:hypothetical protein
MLSTPANRYRIDGIEGGRRHPTDLQALVDKHAALIGQGFGLTDRHFNHLGHAGLGDTVDTVAITSIINGRVPTSVRNRLEELGVATATEPVRLPATRELEMTARICVPVRVDAILLGYLWFMDDPSEPVDPDKLSAARRAASEIGTDLYRLRYLERGAQDQERAVLQALASGRELADGEVLEQLEQRITRAGWYVAVVAECSEPLEDPSLFETEIDAATGHLRRTRRSGEIIAAVVDGRGLIIFALANVLDAERQGDALLAAAKRTLDHVAASLVVGIGAPVQTLADIQSSFAQAVHCVRVAKQRGLHSRFVSWGSLGADRAIVALLGEGDPAHFIPSSVRRLQATEENGAVLTETLWRYLETAGDAQAAAEANFVHRSTLYHRLHRIEVITGCDLGRGDDRLELHLGLRLSRMARPADPGASS